MTSTDGILDEIAVKKLTKDITDLDPGTNIHVYREFKPTRDAIEYTMYFRMDGKKHRIDFDLLKEELDWLDTPEDQNKLTHVIARRELRHYIEVWKNHPDRFPKAPATRFSNGTVI